MEHSKNVYIKMRDGVRLAADILKPSENGVFPTVLVRLPYLKDNFINRPGYMDPERFLKAGYAMVIQDCRGSGWSEGKYFPWQLDAEDGWDTVEWIAAQQWSNGSVGMMGASNLGSVQIQAASMRPPHLKTICPAATSSAIPFFNNGVLNLGACVLWYVQQAGNFITRIKNDDEKVKRLSLKLEEIKSDLDRQFNYLPLKDLPVAQMKDFGMELFIAEWLEYLDDEAHWAEISSPAPIEDAEIPIFHIANWYDHLSKNTLQTYEKIKNSGNEYLKNNQWLYLGLWRKTLDLIGGETVAWSEGGDITDVHIKWFDHWLKGIDNGVEKSPKVWVYTMGNEEWRPENKWPLESTEFTKYYFHSAGNANTREGDGVLSAVMPEEENCDSFTYDPSDPVPTKSGIIIAPGDSLRQNQNEVEMRPDILVYTSEVLKTDMEVTGPVKIKLWASSTAFDTDFTGKLVEVLPDGNAYNLLEGIVRARYRNSLSKPELLIPGEINEYTINLGGVGNLFSRGSRIRIEISSSNFPKHDRNLNTGNKIGMDSEMIIAQQKIYHSKDKPSHVLLPLIPGRN